MNFFSYHDLLIKGKNITLDGFKLKGVKEYDLRCQAGAETELILKMLVNQNGVSSDSVQEELNYNTCEIDGKKYLFLYMMKGFHMVWSIHFIVEGIDHENCIGLNDFNVNKLFRPISRS